MSPANTSALCCKSGPFPVTHMSIASHLNTKEVIRKMSTSVSLPVYSGVVVRKRECIERQAPAPLVLLIASSDLSTLFAYNEITGRYHTCEHPAHAYTFEALNLPGITFTVADCYAYVSCECDNPGPGPGPGPLPIYPPNRVMYSEDVTGIPTTTGRFRYWDNNNELFLANIVPPGASSIPRVVINAGGDFMPNDSTSIFGAENSGVGGVRTSGRSIAVATGCVFTNVGVDSVTMAAGSQVNNGEQGVIVTTGPTTTTANNGIGITNHSFSANDSLVVSQVSNASLGHLTSARTSAIVGRNCMMTSQSDRATQTVFGNNLSGNFHSGCNTIMGSGLNSTLIQRSLILGNGGHINASDHNARIRNIDNIIACTVMANMTNVGQSDTSIILATNTNTTDNVNIGSTRSVVASVNTLFNLDTENSVFLGNIVQVASGVNHQRYRFTNSTFMGHGHIQRDGQNQSITGCNIIGNANSTHKIQNTVLIGNKNRLYAFHNGAYTNNVVIGNENIPIPREPASMMSETMLDYTNLIGYKNNHNGLFHTNVIGNENNLNVANTSNIFGYGNTIRDLEMDTNPNNRTPFTRSSIIGNGTTVWGLSDGFIAGSLNFVTSIRPVNNVFMIGSDCNLNSTKANVNPNHNNINIMGYNNTIVDTRDSNFIGHRITATDTTFNSINGSDNTLTKVYETTISGNENDITQAENVHVVGSSNTMNSPLAVDRRARQNSNVHGSSNVFHAVNSVNVVGNDNILGRADTLPDPTANPPVDGAVHDSANSASVLGNSNSILDGTFNVASIGNHNIIAGDSELITAMGTYISVPKVKDAVVLANGDTSTSTHLQIDPSLISSAAGTRVHVVGSVSATDNTINVGRLLPTTATFDRDATLTPIDMSSGPQIIQDFKTADIYKDSNGYTTFDPTDMGHTMQATIEDLRAQVSALTVIVKALVDAQP